MRIQLQDAFAGNADNVAPDDRWKGDSEHERKESKISMLMQSKQNNLICLNRSNLD